MNKWQAIQRFWSSFGIPAYDEFSVPEDAELPYITYNAAVGDFEQPVSLTASVWYRSTSWAAISRKADEIGASIVPCKILRVDGGYVYVCKGSPFAQRMSDDDDSIRRMYINMQVEFFSN